MLTSTNFQFKSNKKEGVHYDKNINRFEFTEMLVRIAEKKYIRHGSDTKYSEAVEKLLSDIDIYISHERQKLWGGRNWRHTELLKEDLNLCLLINMKNLEALHRKYTSRLDRVSPFAKPGEFTLEDGLKLVEEAGLNM